MSGDAYSDHQAVKEFSVYTGRMERYKAEVDRAMACLRDRQGLLVPKDVVLRIAFELEANEAVPTPLGWKAATIAESLQEIDASVKYDGHWFALNPTEEAWKGRLR